LAAVSPWRATEFEIDYTAAQQSFRAEVSAWLARNVPYETVGVDEHRESAAVYAGLRKLGRALGERTWQLLTEPSAGSDLAAVAMTATGDGDDYVLGGQKVFIGSGNGADALWTIARCGPAQDRHRNLSWFMIDARPPGVTVVPQHIVGGMDKNTIFSTGSGCPAGNLVGGENKGWQVANTHLDHEHGLRSATHYFEGQPELLRAACEAIVGW
jgi:alkylation response protein AidB-like acyl-CoA dehydrogenase